MVRSVGLTLSDVFVPSGCVTSAETVLIKQQSTAQLRKALSERAFELSVVSFSAQSLASVATHFGVTVAAAYNRLETLFKSHLGVDCVVDTGAATDLALMEVRWCRAVPVSADVISHPTRRAPAGPRGIRQAVQSRSQTPLGGPSRVRCCEQQPKRCCAGRDDHRCRGSCAITVRPRVCR